MNPKLSAIGALAAGNLQRFISESSGDILKAWDATVEEAQANETNPKLMLSFSIKLDLEKDTIETALAFSTRYKLSACDHIPDPNQGVLPIEEDAVEKAMKKRK